jgi:ABC-type bacteriocin/lantibiotic exporter with double-glycine peptidase domain
MALDRFGVRLSPAELNHALKTHNGYTARGWIKWDAVVAVSEGKVRVESISAPTHHDIDAALKNGELVLAKMFLNRVIPHWVVVVGKDGTDYLIRDPMGDGHRLEALTKFHSDIYGIRIVKPAARSALSAEHEPTRTSSSRH